MSEINKIKDVEKLRLIKEAIEVAHDLEQIRKMAIAFENSASEKSGGQSPTPE